MPRRAKEPTVAVEPPAGFRVERGLPVGRYPLLTAFPGLDRLPLAAAVEPDPDRRAILFENTLVEIADADLWMYVAPWEIPPQFRGRWRPVVARGTDCIVIGDTHLKESPALMLFMDIFHELCHVRQRHAGANLWPDGVRYVDRWTEIEAYRLVVDEARRLGAPPEFLRDYLKVEWISPEEHRELLTTLNVPAN